MLQTGKYEHGSGANTYIYNINNPRKNTTLLVHVSYYQTGTTILDPYLYIDNEQISSRAFMENSHYNYNRGKVYTYLKQLDDKK